MPVYNREEMVGDAIRSVVEQDFADFELLIVDGASTDRTGDVLAMWSERDPRVVVLRTATNEGMWGALDRGLAHARGQYLARLDSDDLMMPGRLAAQAALLDERPEVVLVSCAYDVVDLAGNRVGRWKRDDPHEVTVFLLHFFNVIGGHGQVMFRLADAREEGGYAHMPSEDYDLWVRLRRRGRIETLPLVGMIKRVHPQQLIRSYDRMEVRREAWSRIMRGSLEPWLQRTVSDEELAALITLWRFDEVRGMGSAADDFMREAFARFCAEVPDRALQAHARRQVAWQWYLTGRYFGQHGHRLEALKYLARAARWRLSRTA